MSQPSREFVDAFCTNQSPSIDCELCGRCHFAAGDKSDIGERELAELRAAAVAKPLKYHEDKVNDSIGWGCVDGRQVVWNCPCGHLARYEVVFWLHRDELLRYVKARNARELKDAQRTAAAIDASGGVA